MRCLCESAIKQAKIEVLEMVIEVLEVQGDTEDHLAMTTDDAVEISYHRGREDAFYDAAIMFEKELLLVQEEVIT